MFETIVITVIILSALAWSTRRMWRTVRGKGGCDGCASAPADSNAGKVQAACGCGDCPLQPACSEKKAPAKTSCCSN